MSFLFGRESSCKVGWERCWVVVQIQSCGLLLKFGEHLDPRVLPHTIWLGQSTTPHWNFPSLSFWFICSLLCSLPISIFHISMFSYDLQHKQLIQHLSRFKGKKKERDPNLGLSPSWKCNKSFIKFWCFINMLHSQSCNWKLSENHWMTIPSVSRGHIYQAELFLYQRGGELNAHCSVNFAFSFFSRGYPANLRILIILFW